MTAPAPYTPKPSILDRVLGRLIPTDQYGSLLDPVDRRAIQKQGLLQLGAGILSQTGAESGLPAIGRAIQGLDVPGMAEHALRIKAYQGQQQLDQAVAAAATRHPPGTYEGLSAMIGEIAGLPGGDAIAAKYAPLLQAMKPAAPRQGREPIRIPDYRDNKLGSPTHGMVGTVLLDPETYDRVGFVPQQQKDETAKPTPQQGQHAEFGAGALAAWQQVERIRTQTPGVEEEVGRVLASPAFAQAVPGFRSSGDAVRILQQAGASTAAQNYMRAKWSFLDNVIRTRIPGGRMSGALLQQIGQEFLPSLDPGANSQVRQNELQAILTAQGESGFDTNPALWNNAVKRHGVAGIDLQALLAGGSGDSRLNAIKDKYR